MVILFIEKCFCRNIYIYLKSQAEQGTIALTHMYQYGLNIQGFRPFDLQTDIRVNVTK